VVRTEGSFWKAEGENIPDRNGGIVFPYATAFDCGLGVERYYLRLPSSSQNFFWKVAFAKSARKSEMAARRRKKRISPFFRTLIRFVVRLAVLLAVVTLVQVAVLRYADPPFTVAMILDYLGHVIKSQPYRAPNYIWQPLEKISPHLQRAVLAGEDQRFEAHHGFDMIEIRKAIKDILLEKRVRGASTISMQTARTIYLLPVRSIWRKIMEAYYTALIELLWNKRRILEMYLNTVDWGTGLMGAEAASLSYFRRHAGQLNRRQAALLAAILPNPHRLSAVKPNRYVTMRAKRILADMHLMPLL
jgi:monofunctional biosynthetic peptidoglycan transglycosylase